MSPVLEPSRDSTAKRGQTAEIAERRREKEKNALGESLRSPRSLRLKGLFAGDSSRSTHVL